MQPPSEMVHWGFATGFLFLGLVLLAEAIVGPEVWARRRWRLYLWPSIVFGFGVLMWPVMSALVLLALILGVRKDIRNAKRKGEHLV